MDGDGADGADGDGVEGDGVDGDGVDGDGEDGDGSKDDDDRYRETQRVSQTSSYTRNKSFAVLSPPAENSRFRPTDRRTDRPTDGHTLL